MRTFGWLVGELIRRVDGRTVGTFWRDEIAEPLGLDFWIGLPEEIEPRVARLVLPKDDLGALLKKLGGDLLLTACSPIPADLFGYNEMWNTRALHAAELPSSNGIGDARSLARMYASCIGEVDGVRTLQPATVAAATVEQACGKDDGADDRRAASVSASCSASRSAPPTGRARSATPAPAVRSRSPIPTPASASAT